MSFPAAYPLRVTFLENVLSLFHVVFFKPTFVEDIVDIHLVNALPEFEISEARCKTLPL